MVAAAALGDIVKQAGQIEQFRPLEIAHQAAAQRKFVREFRHREAAQVAHDIQDVLVDGVDVIQIVLHLADDAAEGGDVAAEHAVFVHAFQFAYNPRPGCVEFA